MPRVQERQGVLLVVDDILCEHVLRISTARHIYGKGRRERAVALRYRGSTVEEPRGEPERATCVSAASIAYDTSRIDAVGPPKMPAMK